MFSPSSVSLSEEEKKEESVYAGPEDHIDWSKFATENQIVINDTQPALASVELLRILLDEEMLVWDEAWRIVLEATTFTSHSMHARASEHWSVELLEKILPRHLDLIYLINFYLIEHLKEIGVDEHKIANLSLVDESFPKSIRFGNLCFYSAHRSFGVTNLHVENLKRGLFSDLNEVYPSRLKVLSPTVCPVRWIYCANRPLTMALTESLGGDDSWLTDLR